MSADIEARFEQVAETIAETLISLHSIRESLAHLERENATLREDKERLDSGTIRIVHRDEFGDPAPCIHAQIDLRAAIDAARKEGTVIK